MTNLLKELTDLFTKQGIPNIIEDFKKSSFFIDHYLTQTFAINEKFHKKKIREQLQKEGNDHNQNEINRIYEKIKPTLKSLRFKKKSFYLKNDYPIQLNQELTKKLETEKELKVIKENNGFSTYVMKWKGSPNNSLQFSVSNNEIFNEPLKAENITLQETKELKMFIDGSNENPEQFETWSAEKMYKEWLLLRLSNIEKPDWPIMKYVFFLFINQISCILNSYILYGLTYNNYYEKQKYNKYLKALDEFTKNGGLYKDLLDVHFLFCEWYDIRIKYAIDYKKKRLVKINKKNDRLIDDLFKKNNGETAITFRTIQINNGTRFYSSDSYGVIREFFQKTLNSTNFCLLIFTGYFPHPNKSNQMYAFPVFPILGIPYKTHDGFIYTPKIQLLHDFDHGIRSLVPYFDHLYSETTTPNNKIDDTRIFFEKMLFLMKLNNSNINKKELNNAHYFLWWFLHEKEFLYIHHRFSNFSTRLQSDRQKLFFDIKIFKLDLEILNKVILESSNSESKKKNLKHKLSIKNSFYENTENFNQLTSSIQLLIEVCRETLNDPKKNELFEEIQNKTIQFYNTNNLNNRKAVSENNNNTNSYNNIISYNNTNSYSTNKVNTHVDKYLKRHPELTNEMLEDYATNDQIRKMYSLSNTTINISSFRNDFIRRVKYRDKIKTYISSHPDLTNEEVNKLESLLQNEKKLENLKNSNPNSSNLELLQILLKNFSNKHIKSKPLPILAKQRRAFAERAFGTLTGSPLTENNF
jgi:hypothetical protein